MFEQNNNHSEEVTMMQEKITNLTDRVSFNTLGILRKNTL